MESLQVGGVILFIYGVLWASATLKDARRSLEGEYLESLRRIERMTVLNALGPVVPVVLGLGIVTLTQTHAFAVATGAIGATVLLMALRGMVHARRMRGEGLPAAYAASYAKAHVIRAASVALCAATLAPQLIG